MASDHLLSRLPFQLPFKLSSNAKSGCSHHRQSTTIEGDDEADHSAPLLETSPPPKFSHSNNNFVFYFSLALALLSAINVALLPATLSRYQACSFSDTAHDDAAVSSAWTAKTTTPHPSVYEHVWPDRIARVSRKLKQAVWGHGVQFYVTVEDSTIMRFPIPSTGGPTCALLWQPPPESSARAEDLTTKGDVREIEVWQLIAPSSSKDLANGSSASSNSSTSMRMNELDYDALSYSTLPVRGELLGVLDFTAKPNSTTVEFACPSEEKEESLVVELRCQRVACHVSFLQIHLEPSFGVELLRRKEAR